MKKRIKTGLVVLLATASSACNSGSDSDVSAPSETTDRIVGQSIENNDTKAPNSTNSDALDAASGSAAPESTENLNYPSKYINNSNLNAPVPRTEKSTTGLADSAQSDGAGRRTNGGLDPAKTSNSAPGETGTYSMASTGAGANSKPKASSPPISSSGLNANLSPGSSSGLSAGFDSRSASIGASEDSNGGVHSSSDDDSSDDPVIHPEPFKKVLALGSMHGVQLLKEGQLLRVWGKNGQGQLGTGGYRAQEKAKINESFDNVTKVQESNGEKVVLVSVDAYGAQSAAVSRGGRLYSWGATLTKSQGDFLDEPTLETYFDSKGIKIASVVLGTSVRAAISQDKDLYLWGDNSVHQLGQGNPSFILSTISGLFSSLNPLSSPFDDTPKPVPYFIKYEIKIVQVAFGDSNTGTGHIIALSDKGQVYTWGHNLKGQLGTGDTSIQEYPYLVRFDQSGSKTAHQPRMTFVAAGRFYSMAVSESGEVYTWGSGSFGQLGHDNRKDEYLPKKVKALEGIRIQSVVASAVHSAAISLTDHQVYMWGDGTHGKLGLGDSEPRLKPVRLNFDNTQPDVVDVALGTDNSAVLTKSGEVFVWGESSVSTTLVDKNHSTMDRHKPVLLE